MKYTQEKSLLDCINYFASANFSQSASINIGLFLILKSMGTGVDYPTRNVKAGSKDEAKKIDCLQARATASRCMHQLSALHAANKETGGVCCSLFPLALTNKEIPKDCLYNKATVFDKLVGRMTDTISNNSFFQSVLVLEDGEKYVSFKPQYLDAVTEELEGKRISIEHLCAWLHRYVGIDAPDDLNDEQIRNITILHFLSSYNITKDEYQTMFVYNAESVVYTQEKISPVKLRGHLQFKDDFSPKVTIEETKKVELPKEITKEQCIEYLKKMENHVFDEAFILSQLAVDDNKPCPFERNRIIFGAPGTGKSYVLNKDAELLLKGEQPTRVTFHPEYTYYNFVGSYKPIVKKNEEDATEEVSYSFIPGPFTDVLLAAMRFPRARHLLIIEEINRARVASVFGDIFQLLDRNEKGESEYVIKPSPDLRRYLEDELGMDVPVISIPKNMFIWATMNSADQGVFPMDTAFKRRWDFEYIGVDNNEELASAEITIGENVMDWNILRKKINQKLESLGVNEDKLIGPFFIAKKYLSPQQKGAMITAEEKKIAEAKFLGVFKSKVISYLFEDAAKHMRSKLFEGCETRRYSQICQKFDKIGIAIFGTSFTTDMEY